MGDMQTMKLIRVAGLLPLLLVAGCAYHNPTEASAPPADPSVPTQVTLGVSPGSGAGGGTATVTARVQNANGAALANVLVTFTTTRGTVSPAQVATSAGGAATATLTASDTADVTAVAGTVSAHTLVIATPITPTPGPTLPLSFLNVSGSATTGVPVTFGVSSSAVGAVWIWSFGDGATEQGSAFNTTHTYTRAGTYTASVSSASTQASSATIVVTEPTAAPPPTTSAGFVATIACPKTTTLAQACNVATTLNGVAQQSSTITRVDWDWGDGQTTHTEGSLAPVSSHTYANAGTYTVFATVTGAPPLGVSQTVTTSIKVTVPTP
jgi:hypothetical protein